MAIRIINSKYFILFVYLSGALLAVSGLMYLFNTFTISSADGNNLNDAIAHYVLKYLSSAVALLVLLVAVSYLGYLTARKNNKPEYVAGFKLTLIVPGLLLIYLMSMFLT